MQDLPEMFKDDEIAKAIKLANEASVLCCDLALDTGALINWTEEPEDTQKFFDMLGYAIDTLSNVVNEIGQLYCMAPYYRSAGMDGEEVEGFKKERLEGVEMCRQDVGEILSYHTIMRAEHPALRDPESKIYIYMPGEKTGDDLGAV